MFRGEAAKPVQASDFGVVVGFSWGLGFVL